MSMYDLKQLPHIVKSVTLIFIIVQTCLMFLAGHYPFAWFVILTTILELIVCVAVFCVFALDIPLFVTTPIWPIVEMSYSGVFAVAEVINSIYYLINFFAHLKSWVFLLLALIVCALLALVWAFNAFQFFKLRSTSSFSGNQATRNYPSYPTGGTSNTTGEYPRGANPA